MFVAAITMIPSFASNPSICEWAHKEGSELLNLLLWGILRNSEVSEHCIACFESPLFNGNVLIEQTGAQMASIEAACFNPPTEPQHNCHIHFAEALWALATES